MKRPCAPRSTPGKRRATSAPTGPPRRGVPPRVPRGGRRGGPVHILIANAGSAEPAPFKRADAVHFRRMFELNVLGVVHSIRAVLDGMVAAGSGRIVVMASTAGLKGYAAMSAYCTAKHAAVGLVR